MSVSSVAAKASSWIKFPEPKQILRNARTVAVTAVALYALSCIQLSAADKASCFESCTRSYPPPNPQYYTCLILCLLFG